VLSSNTIGTVFKATGAGTGTGTAYGLMNVSLQDDYAYVDVNGITLADNQFSITNNVLSVYSNLLAGDIVTV